MASADERYQEGLKELASKEVMRNKPALTEEAGLLYYKLRPYVPKDLQASILAFEHDSREAGDFCQDKTMELMKRKFW